MDKQNKTMQTIRVTCDDAKLLPTYATEGSAGADLKADVDADDEVWIGPGQIACVPTGLTMEIPKGYEVQIRSRSGIAFKHQVIVFNQPATIDSDFRGEVKVLLINHGPTAFCVTRYMRIAQLVVASVIQANFIVKPKLSETERGAGGFGSTGLS